MSVFARLLNLAGSRSNARRSKARRGTAWRRPLGEALEARRVLSAGGLFAGNECAPEIDLSAIRAQPTLLQASVGDATISLDLPFLGATLTDSQNDGTPITTGLRWLADPDPEDFPAGATMTPGGRFDWDLSGVPAGEYTVTVIGIDGGTPALASADRFVITLTEPNLAPALVTPTAEFTSEVTVGTELMFGVTATDANSSDELVYTVSTSDDGSLGTNPDPVVTPADASGRSGTFSWTPTQTGTFSLDIEVSDGQATDTVTTQVTVYPENLSPNIAMLADLTGDAGSEVVVPVSISDPNVGQDVTLVVKVTDPSDETTFLIDDPSAVAPDLRLIRLADVDGEARYEIRWTPSGTELGAHEFELTATDAGFGSLPNSSLGDNEAFSLIVVEAPVAPVITLIDDQDPATASFNTVDDGSPIGFGITATDANGDGVIFSLVLPDLAGNPNPSFTTAGVFNWTPTVQGSYEFQVTASDGALTDVETFTIEVLEAPVAPVFDSVIVPAEDGTPDGTRNLVDSPTDPTVTVGAVEPLGWGIVIQDGNIQTDRDAALNDTLAFEFVLRNDAGDLVVPTNTPEFVNSTSEFSAPLGTTLAWLPDAADFAGGPLTATFGVSDGVATTVDASFVFQVVLDDTPPQIVVFPTNEIAPTDTLTLEFEGFIDSSSLTDATFRLDRLPGGPRVPVDIVAIRNELRTRETEVDGEVVTVAYSVILLEVDANLAAGTYVLTVLAGEGLVDSVGNGLTSDLEYGFTVVTPTNPV